MDCAWSLWFPACEETDMKGPRGATARHEGNSHHASQLDACSHDGLSAFLSARSRLFGIAFRLLGSAGEAEDVVQEVWVRWQTTDRSRVGSPTAFLAAAAKRLAINVLQSARVRRETCAGTWLPELVDLDADPGREAERGEALKCAVLLLLEKLSPTERAAYLLREAFGRPYREIGDVLRVEEANARQIVTRAREHLCGERRTSVSPAEQRCLLEAFVAAARTGDLATLESLFGPRRVRHGSCHKSRRCSVMTVWVRQRRDQIKQERSTDVKLVIIGGTGLIGSKLVAGLRDAGHQPVAASPDTGVNTLTGQGLAEAIRGASVVVDVSNSPSFEEAAVMKFFTTSTRNLLEYATAAGVKHYVALSVVGTERMPDSPYLRAKSAQEMLIKGGGIPYSIVHATQFFEFIKRIADDATAGTTVRLPSVLIQPMAADDVAKAVGRVALGAPLNGTVEIAGPQQFRFDELIRRGLRARNDPREIVVDPHARYFGAELGERSLLPAGEARLGEIHLEDWLHQQQQQPVLQRH
jgi:RNA polymerase sigma factor (sigma-70 family)